MKPIAILREAWLNTITGTAGIARLAVTLLAIVALLTIADLGTVRRIDDQAREFVASKASVTVLSAPGHVSGAQCESLNSLPGVRAAGALRKVDSLRPTLLPGTTVPYYQTTPTLPSVLDSSWQPSQQGLVLSDQAAELLGVKQGQALSFETGNTRVALVYSYPDDGRINAYSYAALAPQPATGRYDECWVDQWPQSDELRPALMATLRGAQSSGGDAITYGQLNSHLGSSLQSNTLFRDRITAWAPVAAFVTGWLLTLGGVWARRLTLTSYLHLGVTRRAVYVMVVIETLIALVPTCCGALLAGTWFAATGVNADTTTNWVLATLPAAAAGVGALLGASMGALSLTENQLFAHFKSRL